MNEKEKKAMYTSLLIKDGRASGRMSGQKDRQTNGFSFIAIVGVNNPFSLCITTRSLDLTYLRCYLVRLR